MLQFEKTSNETRRHPMRKVDCHQAGLPKSGGGRLAFSGHWLFGL